MNGDKYVCVKPPCIVYMTFAYIIIIVKHTPGESIRGTKVYEREKEREKEGKGKNERMLTRL